MFKLLLKYSGAKSEEEVLKFSVLYGWSLVAIGLVGFAFIVIFANSPQEVHPTYFMNVVATLWILSFLLFMFRYTSVKPILGMAAAGITTITLTLFLESVFNRKDNFLSMGAMLGAILVLFVLLMKNMVVSWYYLSLETIRLVSSRRYKLKLDTTSL